MIGRGSGVLKSGIIPGSRDYKIDEIMNASFGASVPEPWLDSGGDKDFLSCLLGCELAFLIEHVMDHLGSRGKSP